MCASDAALWTWVLTTIEDHNLPTVALNSCELMVDGSLEPQEPPSLDKRKEHNKLSRPLMFAVLSH